MAEKKLDQEELEDLLSGERKVALKFEKEVQKLDTDFQIVLVESNYAHNELVPGVLKFLLEKEFWGIYITINTPAEILEEKLKKQDLPVGNMVFIDGITLHSGGKKSEKDNYYYVESPKDLTEISVLLETIFSELEGKKIVFLDSVSVLMVYNKEESVKRFVHSLVSKARVNKANTVLLMTKKQETGLEEYLSEFCDKIIEL